MIVETCTTCGVALKPRAQTKRKGDRCRSCCARASARSPEHRAKISAAIKAHANTPEELARRAERMRRNHADPEFKARHAAGIAAAIERNRQRPDWIEGKREAGRRLYRDHASRPEVIAKRSQPEVIARAARKNVEHRLGWCPLSYREDYMALLHGKHMTAAELGPVIEGQIAADIRAYRAGTLPVGQFFKVRAAMRYLAEREREAA